MFSFGVDTRIFINWSKLMPFDDSASDFPTSLIIARERATVESGLTTLMKASRGKYPDCSDC
jgi:hypothetical protein